MGINLLGDMKARWEDRGWTDVRTVLESYFRTDSLEACCEGYWFFGYVVPDEEE
jgi:hypothetical protein